ncbi:MAG: prolyl aminopeptidase [Pseudonocardia sp.]
MSAHPDGPKSVFARCRTLAREIARSANWPAVRNTIRPRGALGLWRSRAPLTVLLFLTAQDGHLLCSPAGECAVLEPPTGRLPEHGPSRAGVRWLRRIDRYWDVLAFAVTPTALLVTSLPVLWFREYAVVALVLAVAVLLYVVVTFGLAVVLLTYRLISGRERLGSTAVGQLRAYHWTIALLHVPAQRGDGATAAALVDRARHSVSRERSPVLILTGGVTDVPPDRDGPGGLRIERLSPRHPILVGYEPDDLPLQVPAGPGRFRGRDVGLFFGATALIVAMLALIVANDERRVCSPADDCENRPTTYGDALYWLLSRLLGGDPDGLGVTSAGNRAIGVLITIYGVFVLVGIVGRVVQQRIDEDSRTGAEVATEFEKRRVRPATPAAALYPEIEPYGQGMLDVGEGNRVYWEVCGNPKGKPAVVLHGGPGSGGTPGWRRFFDPVAYRIVLFDQRGCGRSTPCASNPAVGLTTNTTHHMIADIERLREHLGIQRWLVFGGSWGSTLGLAYAEHHPGSVSEIVLFSVVNTSHREVEWITRDLRRFFPAQWEQFRAGVPAVDRDDSLVEAYSRLLNDPDPAVREKAAQDWCNWEAAHVAVRSDLRPNPRYADPEFRICFARLVTHYWRHAGWLADGALLAGAPALAGIPGVLVHGRLDLSGPPDLAWDLAQVWQDSELVLVDNAGHGATDDAMVAAVIKATDRFATRS